MADVFLAVSRSQTGLEKLAVIKRLRPEVAEDDEELEHFKGMFWDEAKLAMLLSHPNVVHTYDASDTEDSLYIVMEYIEGQSLGALQRELARREEPLAHHVAAFIVSETLAGLHYAHELHDLKGHALTIIHRDVSPQNILLAYDASVKLVDFGVAKASSRSTATRAGTFKGKARYMAPEQVLNGKVDLRVDLYAAGIVLWETIARRPLVTGANTIEQLVNVVKTEPERLSSIVPDVDPELEAIVHRAIARDPAARFPTALAMREALQGYIARVGGSPRADLATLMTTLFAKRRAETAKVVRERLALEATRDAPVDSGTSPVIVLDSERGEGSLPSLGSGARSLRPGSQTITGTGTGPQMPSVEEPPPSRSSRKTIPLLIGALLLLVLVVGVMAGMLFANKKPEVAVAPPPPATTTAPPPATTQAPVVPTATEAAPPPPAASTVAIAEPARPPVGYQAPPPRALPPAAPWGARPAAPKAATPETPAAAAPAPAAEAQGFLTLDTYPWTKVSENGRVLGNTPLVGVPLAAGTHVLTLDNPQDNIHQTTTVVVKAGETTAKRLGF